MLSKRRLARLLARAILYPCLTLLNMWVLAGRARLKGRPNALPLTFTGKSRVLVLAAHPDDETIGCAGAILAHLMNGDRVEVLVVTDGSGSRAGGLPPRRMAQQRGEEAAKVARLFGAPFELLGLQEGQWPDDELLRPLAARLERYRPDVIYAPSCVDFHPEHLRVACLLGAELSNSAIIAGLTVRIYEMQVPLGVELANRFLPLGDALDTKQAAIMLYSTQRGALDLWHRQARYLGAIYDARGGAEAFWELSPIAYSAVVARGNWDWKTTPFTSLTGRPFGDILAHLRGGRARRSLRLEAESHA